MHPVLNLVSRRLFLKEASVTAAMTAVAPLPQPVVVSNEWIEIFDGKTLEGCTKIQRYW